MTTSLDTKLIPKVYDTVRLYGKEVVLSVSATKTYDPTTGKTTASTPVTHSLKVTPPENYSSHMIDGDLIQAGDCRIWLPAMGLTFTPANGMLVTFDSMKWRVISIEPVYTGESIALYGLQIRRGN